MENGVPHESTSFQRRHAPKKWGEVFSERVEEMLSRRDARMLRECNVSSAASAAGDALDDDSVSVASSAMPLRSFVRTAKRTSSSVVPPVAQSDWRSHWGNALACYLCHRPAVCECVVCAKCNVVAHTACIEERALSSSSSSSSSSAKKAHRPSRVRLSLSASQRKVSPAPPHVCCFCEEALQADEAHYQRLVERVREEKLRQYCAVVIARRMRIFLEKKRATRKKFCILLLQAFLRGKIRRRQYLNELHTQPRTVVLKLRDLPAALSALSHVVVLTVHDTFKNVQLFRYDKTAQQCAEEAIIIPGLTWHVTLLVTLAVREDGQSFFVLGQAQVAVRDIENILKPRDITMHFYEKVVWMPQEVHGCKHAHLITSPNFTINSLRTIFSPLELRCTLQYLPQNPVTTVSAMVFAPPLDILKRAVDLSVKKKKQQQHDGSVTGGASTAGSSAGVGNTGSSAVMYRNSRYWICLHRLRLWFFQYYTDASPRFGSDVTQANAVVIFDKGQPTSLLNLVHADGRTWLLEFSSRREAKKFALALQESQKALHEKSIYTAGKEFHEEISFGFNVPLN